MLESVEKGIDMFDGAYPFTCADFGYGLVFPLDIQQNIECSSLKINLRDSKYAKHFQPILKGCQCMTCTDHTCAYIHHLLNTKEMLAEVLLTW